MSRSRCALNRSFCEKGRLTPRESRAGPPRLCLASPRKRQGAAVALRQGPLTAPFLGDRGPPTDLRERVWLNRTNRASAASSASWFPASSLPTSESPNRHSRPTSRSASRLLPKASSQSCPSFNRSFRTHVRLELRERGTGCIARTNTSRVAR